MSEQIRRFDKSHRLQQRSHRLIPGGAHTYAKGDDQYPVLAPGFIERGIGCHVWDVDGNEYIEYGMGNCAVALGHAYPRWSRAAAAAMELRQQFHPPGARSRSSAAEKLPRPDRGAEMVKFCKDGSDATTGAVRLARAYHRTRPRRDLRRPPVLLGRRLVHRHDRRCMPAFPKAIRRLTVTFRYNDLDSVAALFASYPGQIAVLILEAARRRRIRRPAISCTSSAPALPRARRAVHPRRDDHRLPLVRRGRAEGLRHRARPLRVRQGARPTASSVSALAGKREFMRLGGLDHTDEPRVFLLSTTHGAETHALAAAIATMRRLQRASR